MGLEGEGFSGALRRALSGVFGEAPEGGAKRSVLTGRALSEALNGAFLGTPSANWLKDCPRFGSGRPRPPPDRQTRNCAARIPFALCDSRAAGKRSSEALLLLSMFACRQHPFACFLTIIAGIFREGCVPGLAGQWTYYMFRRRVGVVRHW